LLQEGDICRYENFIVQGWSSALIRVTLGLAMWPHGAQKLFGWFGGFGFEGTMGFFTGTVGLPWIIGFLVIIIEFFGALLLVAGFATRLMATLFIALGLGIPISTHIQNGFFMNWLGNQKGEGYEYFLLLLAMAIFLLISGGGRGSVDAWQQSRNV
jgi:putative oxidoreductase